MTLLEQPILNEHLAKQIVQIGLIIYIKSQKLSMIQFLHIDLKIILKDIMKLYYKNLNYLLLKTIK